MSLWEVDDEATCLLMTEFYKNWIGEGKNKHDALELAKQYVRSHKEKGWDNPKYWASFVLIDAIARQFRLLYQTTDGEYKSTKEYYIPHMAKLYNE